MKISLSSRFLFVAVLTMIGTLFAQTVSEKEIRLREARHKEQVEGDLDGAIKIYQAIAADRSDRRLAAEALLQLGSCYQKQGSPKAYEVYASILKEFSDQSVPAAEARLRLAKNNASSARGELTQRKVTPELRGYSPATVTGDAQFTAFVVAPSRILVWDLRSGKQKELGRPGLIAPGDSTTSAAISPDGSAIAYNQIHVDGTCDLRLIGAKAPEPRVLQRNLHHFYVRDWSHDGSSILINEISENERAVPARAILVNAKSGEMKTVYSWPADSAGTLDGVVRGGLRLSPNGKFLAGSAPEIPPARGTGIFVVAIGDNKPQKLLVAPHDAYVFGWSPDGEKLLFVSDQSGSYDLWAVTVTNGQIRSVPVVLKKDLGMVQAAGIADNGSLLYASREYRSTVYVGELDVSRAAIRNLQEVPAPRGTQSSQATWSSDGSHLLIERRVYQIGTPGDVNLITRDIATGEEREVKPPEGTAPDGRSFQASWSLDKDSILFAILQEPKKKDPFKLVIADLHGEAVKSQVEVAASRGKIVTYLFPHLSPDQRQVYVAKGHNSTNLTSVVRIDLQTGAEKEICAARPLLWAVSPDASQIACAGYGGAIEIRPTAPGASRRLVKGARFGSIAWTADGQNLIYTTPTAETGSGSAGLYWVVSAMGGTPRRMNVALSELGSMSVHPNNRRIAISSGGSTTELWVLENLLPEAK